ncbi:MAG: restriction endonuclease subunit S [Betaproteobacteria bacterium]|nr:restriction endonuclease subunit S [Betaproteobacteria bacterium]
MYPAYKESGAVWLGVIPQHWRVGKLKNLIDPTRRITYGIVQAGPDTSGGVPYIRPADMTNEQGVTDPNALLRTTREIAEEYRRSLVRAGDLVCSIGPSFGKLMVVPGWLDGANLTQGTARIAVEAPNVARFVFWALRALPSVSQWEASIGGATFRALNLEPLANTLITIPPTSEQRLIAGFLDRETAKIDALIAEQEKLIALLTEKRQATISQAVTRGLDPDVPMKDSGVAWVGQVPDHWEIGTIKKWFVTSSGGTPDTARQDEFYADRGGYPWIRTTDLGNDRLATYEVAITEAAINASACAILPKNSVLVAMYGGEGTIGKNALLLFESCINQAVCALLPNEDFDSRYVWRFIQFFRPYWMIGAESSRKDPNISQALIRNAVMLRPPLHEQLAIADYLDVAGAKLDALEQDAERSIALLRERRSALITAGVTGQIDVRGAVQMAHEAPEGVTA